MIRGRCSSRYSIGAVPRLVAPVAPVRFRVVASFFTFWFAEKIWLVIVGIYLFCSRFAFIAQLAEHALSKRKVTSSILVEGSPKSDMV